MAEITINGVKYTNVPNKKAGTKFAASLTQSNIGASQAVQDYVNSSYFYPLVNAIDINWNGVEVDENSYINSTSDLITYIATKGSNVDLTSYATKNYVDQKIEDVVGGAPETLDTLKELADALANDATLAYVTEALDGKADKSSLDDYATVAYVTTELDKKADLSDIPSAPDLTPYATVSYVTEELDKKVDVSDMPVVPDMTNYVTYTDANSYYLSKENKSDLYELNPDSTSYILNNPFKLSTGNIPDFIIGTNNQFTANNHVGNFILGFNNSIQGKGAHRNVIIGSNHLIDGAMSSIVIGAGNIIRRIGAAAFGTFNVSNNAMFSIGNGTDIYHRSNAFEIQENGNIYIVNDNNYSCLQTILNSKANLSDIPSAPDLTPYVTYTQANSYYAGKNDIPDMTNYATQSDVSSAFGSLQDIVEHDYATVSYVTTELKNKADINDIPDMTNYVDVTSYNALYTEVQRLAYLISYYHPSSPDPGPGQQFEGYWTLNGVRTDSITLSESDSPVTLSFVSNPTIENLTGTLTFYDNDPKVTINTSTGEMTINPSLLGAGTVYSGAGYLYEHGEYSTSFNITITITSATPVLLTPTGYWTWNDIDWGTDGQGDTGWTLGEASRTFTFTGTPASGWTFNYPTGTGITTDTTTGDITIDSSVMTSKGTYTFTASYPGDSTYASATKTFTVTIEKRADASWKDSNDVAYTIQYDMNVNDSTTTLTFNGTPLTGWTFNNNGINGISINSSGNITINPTGMTPDTYYIVAEYPEDATYNYTYRSFAIVISSQPAQEYTNVSVNYDVENTQTTGLPQGTFDTNPFEIGSDHMGNYLIAKVEFSGSEYDMNNFNTDFVLTRDTSYAGNYSTVSIPQYPNYSISNTYSNGVNYIRFRISIYAADSENGTNRDVLTFTHNGYTYLTDGIKSQVIAGGLT